MVAELLAPKRIERVRSTEEEEDGGRLRPCMEW